jgi:DNA-binding MarR family transcriptional regulator
MQLPIGAAECSSDPGERLERVLTGLVRRVVSVRLSDDGAPVERTGYALLASLRDDGPQRLSVLADVVRLDRSTVSRQLAALEHRGLVERRPDGRDRRSHLLALTEDGQRILQVTRARRQQWLREALAGWPESDRAQLAQLLERLARDLFPDAATDVAPPVPALTSTSSSTLRPTADQQERP